MLKENEEQGILFSKVHLMEEGTSFEKNARPFIFLATLEPV
jgi:hypothetical protein